MDKANAIIEQKLDTLGDVVSDLDYNDLVAIAWRKDIHGYI